MKVTLGLGLEDPPSWVFTLANSTYTDQHRRHLSTDANLVFSAAVRQAAATYLSLVAANIPLSELLGDPARPPAATREMLYPGDGTYWAFDHAALTGSGLAAGMTPNPDPNWRPGQPGPDPGPDRRLGLLVHRRPGQPHQLGDADPVRPRLHRLLRDPHPRLGHPPRRPGPDRAAEPVQRRDHRRRRRLEHVLRPAAEQDPRHGLRLLRRRPVRRQRLLPVWRQLPVPDQPRHGLLVRHPLDHPHRPPVRPGTSAGRTPASTCPPAWTPSTPTPARPA